MIREEFEDLNAPRRKTLRTVEPYSLQEENEKLIRQNRELEKSVERLDFFNKLLEKEIEELKNPDGIIPATRKGRKNEPFAMKRKSRGFSNMAFYGLALFTLVFAAFTIYSLFFVNADYPFLRRLKGQIPVSTAVEIAPPADAVTTPVTDEQKNADKTIETPKKNEAQLKEQKKTDAAAAARTATEQNQLKQKAVAEEPAANSGAAVTANTPAPSVNNTSSQNAPPVPAIPESAQPKSGGTSIPETNPPTVGNNTPANAAAETETEKKSFGVYKVVSKANFYTAPNETSLSGQFIYQFSPVTLDALDETKDFILVVTKNNLGTNTKGWLSKKDLRRIDQ